MTAWHWSEYFVAWLRSYIPELGGDPVYIRNFSELEPWMVDPNALAYAESCGDLKMKSLLIERDEWQGRGRFIAVADWWNAMPLPQQLAILLHEMAHSLCGYDSRMQTLKESEFGEFETVLLKPGGKEELLAQFDLKPLDTLTDDRLGHGPRFVRCCLHLWVQCSDEIELGAMQVTGPRYSLNADRSAEAFRALLPEIRTGGHIIDVLKSPMPEAFAALFAQNDAEKRWCFG